MTIVRPPNVPARHPKSQSNGHRVTSAPIQDIHFPIVAIGASAGGLDACRRLLEGFPVDSGMALIFVQHLDPNHKSLIADLLKDNTAMPVMEATDGAVIERDHVYVIAPGTYLSVADGTLHVVKAQPPNGARLPFDVLLNSLAAYAGTSAICVVLSGTGADGSKGLVTLKRRGGFVIVQDPEEAPYDDMPRNAVLTNLADQIIPLKQMQAVILDFGRKSAERPSEAAEPARSKASTSLTDIIELLRKKTAHDFTAYKQGTLQRRVERRMGMKGLGLNGMGEYIAALSLDPIERENLAKDLLINVTSFFRDKQVFDRLKATIVPTLIESHSSELPIRVWIAGCSSGEEAYSIAILFREGLDEVKSNVKLQVFASDVDEDAVTTARDGFYPGTIKSEVSEHRLARFFAKTDSGYRITPDLRSNVVFAVQDILADPPFSRIDLVSCRNVLIYLEPEAQAKAISLFHFALRDSGVLLLGPSETVGKVEGRFETISKSDRLYRHIGRSRPGDMMFSLNVGDNGRLPQRLGVQPPAPRSSALADLCRKIVLNNYAPAAVVINQKNECLYTIGRIGHYLAVAPGYPTIDLLAMTPQSLHTKMRSAIQRCAQQSVRIVASGGTIESDHGSTRRFSIHVDPIGYDGQTLFLICFVDDAEIKAVHGTKDGVVAMPAEMGRIAELETELEATRIELNGAITNLEISGQEQKAINEEALSFNEEYQSTNEELLTSKEELQSLNEELTALNGQLQETLERQRTTSNDLQNILYSTAVATLFLDADLNIRFFTPATKTLFNVIPSDIGRPLADLSSLAIDATLLSDAQLVLVNHAPLEHKIEAKSGLWYMRRIMPYLDEEHVIEGVVITFVDVTEQRLTSEALRVAKRQADGANEAKSRFLAAASHDLRQPLQTLSLLQGLLARRVQDTKAQELLGRFEETLGAMSGMLNALLDINQIEAGTVKAEMQDVCIRKLLKQLRQELTLTGQAKGLDFRVVDSSLIVHTDPNLLEQMLRNLISNAFKYTHSGKVLLGCRRYGKSVHIEIWDTGIGIPAAELKLIFDEYHQIDNDARERSKGLGLGLSIVQRLGNLLGHQIHVKSKQSKGSVFAIEVGRVATSEKVRTDNPPRKSDRSARQTVHTASILVVEDDPEVRALLAQLLTDDGHRVTAVVDGPAALQAAAVGKKLPDIILSDYNLPGGMNGVQIIEALRKVHDLNIPAIVLTGDISTKALIDITGKDMVQLNKPITPNEVSRAIERLLLSKPHGEKPQIIHAHAALVDEPVIFVIDDDDSLRETLCQLLTKHGLAAQAYESSEAFLEHSHPKQGGCLLVDAYLPGMNGIELLQHIKQSGRQIGAIMMTGHSDVQMAVDAMKAGASEFIEKPIGPTDLLELIDRAVAQSQDSTKRGAWIGAAVKQIASLTVRQKEIMELVLAGHPSKNIAADLNISQRTVENHRASIMSKTESKSLPALARLALAASEAV